MHDNRIVYYSEHAPNIRWPPPPTLARQRQSTIMCILAIAPKLLGLPRRLRQREARPAVPCAGGDALDGRGRLRKRSRRGPLELKEEAVFFVVLACGHAKFVDGGDEDGINELDAFWRLALSVHWTCEVSGANMSPGQMRTYGYQRLCSSPRSPPPSPSVRPGTEQRPP